MSDFLTRLVLHAGRALDVIRPRPLSRFEEGVQPLPAWREEDIPLPGAQSPGALATPADATNRPRTVPDVHAGRDSVSAPEQGTRVRVSRSDRSSPDSPHPTVRVQSSPPMTESVTRTEPPQETVRHETTHTITRIVEQVVRPDARPQSGTEDHIPTRTSSPAKAADPLASLAPSQPRGMFVRPIIENSPRDPRQVEPASPPEMPLSDDLTVEITIGRVDVRAVMPPAPKSRAARSAKPELSLDDYLQRRGRRT